MVQNRIEREFDAYSTWRQQVHEAIVGYRDWLSSQKLSDIHVDQRINQLLSTLNDDKLYIAFVAEFSRGKSELINAVFFGDVGQRVVPSGVV